MRQKPLLERFLTRAAALSTNMTAKSSHLKKLYDTEVKSVSMLGVRQNLTWNKTRAGLEAEMPQEKPCEHAYVLKIERQEPF